MPERGAVPGAVSVSGSGTGVRADRLREFFHPESLALVGATDHSRWSANAFDNWRRFGEGRPVYLVHPRHEVVHGEHAVASLSAVGEAIDLAYVMVPTDQVLGVLEEAASIGTRNAIVLTAGFAELGPTGAELESQVADFAAAHDMIVLGPNGNGFVNATGARVPYGLPVVPPLRSGATGIVLQSGAMASVVLAMAQARGIHPSLVVSTGNEAMLAVDDLLSYLVADEATRTIALFLESVRNPQRFEAVASEALEAGKHIVALKVGRSRAGGQVALAHTGAVVGDAGLVRSVLEDLGVSVVESLEDLLATAGLASSTSARLGRRLAVVGASGGACGLVADRADDEGIELPDFPPSTVAGLGAVLPTYASVSNPLDVTGYVVVDPQLSVRALEVVLEDAPGVYDEVLFQLSVPRARPRDPETLLARFERLAALLDASPVPVVLQSTSGSQLGGFADEVTEHFGFFLLDGIEHGMTALGAVARWHDRRARRLERRALAPAPGVPVPAGARGVWGETSARGLLVSAGVPVVPVEIAAGPGEAAAAAAAIGFPVVLKLASGTLVHKSDVGAVALDLRTEEEVRVAAERLLATTAAQDAAAPCLSVAPLRTGGVELLVSVRHDPGWGPVLAVGLGGTWVEVVGDTALLPLPADASDVGSLLDGLRAAPLLGGARGRAAVDRAKLVEAVVAVSRLGAGLGDALDTLEVNPLWAGPDRSEALDALVVWR